MKKILISFVLAIALSGCSLLDAYLLANYDNIEYQLVNKIRTISELAPNECKDQKKSHDNLENIYYISIELRNYSQHIPRNDDSFKMAENLVELAKQGKEMYEKSNAVSEVFCKLKLQQINRSSELAQKTIGKKPRI